MSQCEHVIDQSRDACVKCGAFGMDVTLERKYLRRRAEEDEWIRQLKVDPGLSVGGLRRIQSQTLDFMLAEARKS